MNGNERNTTYTGAEGDTSHSRNEIAISEIWHVIRRRHMPFLCCLMAVVLLSLVYSLILPVRYEGVGRLTVDFSSSNALGASEGIAEATGVDANTKLQTQVNVLETDTIAWDVITRLRLDQSPDAAPHRHILGKAECLSPANLPASGIGPECRRILIDEFHSRLRVQPVSRTEIIEIRYRSKSRELAAKVVNTLADLYVERSFQTKYNAAIRASNWLSSQLDEVKRDAETAEQKFINYQKSTGLIGTDESHNILVERLGALNQQLVVAETERVVKESRYRIAQEGDPEAIAQVVPGGTLQTLHNEEVQLRGQYADLNSKYDENYPRVVAVKEQLAEAEKAMTAEMAQTLTRLKREYDSSLTSEELIRNEFEKQKQEVYDTSEASVQIALLKRDVDASNELYEQLIKDLKEAGILAGIRANTVTMIDAASLPIKPVEPGWARNIAWGIIVGLVAGLGLCFILDSIDTTIKSLKDIADFCPLPALGIVPKIAEPNSRLRSGSDMEDTGRPTIAVLDQPNSETADAYRSLRTALQLSNPGSPPKVVLVTSSLPREGKTTTSVNLATVYSQRNAGILLVDGDLRRGDLRQYFKYGKNPGFSEALAGEDPERFYVTHPNLPNLTILPTGTRPPQPPDMLDSDRMRQLVMRWREEFRTVIIDAPPVIGMSDAIILATMADIYVLVVRARQSRRQDVIRAAELLMRIKHGQSGGILINDLDAGNTGFYGEDASLYDHYFDKSGKQDKNVRV
jgi:capsular exopolysaccharide synthesis family protein